MSTVAEQIRELRKARGWSQEQLARRSKVSTGTIENIETARCNMYLSTAETLLCALGYELRVVKQLELDIAKARVELLARELGLTEIRYTRDGTVTVGRMR